MISTISIALITIISLFIIFFIYKYRTTISQRTNLIDIPDKIRKFHTKGTPLLGGIMIFSVFILINIYLFFFGNLDRPDVIIFFNSSFCFILGLVDDLKKLNYRNKFFFLIIFFIFFLNLEPNLQITKIYFVTFDQYINLGSYSIFFTTLCLILLVNAINLVDGINGLCILINIILLSWLFFITKEGNLFYTVMIISLFYILLFNLKNDIFMGDSGSLFLGCLIGLLIIHNYNNYLTTINFQVENIFIMLMLPGIDMFRVFFQRMLRKKNPFSADRTHLHHLLFDKILKLNTVLTIYLILFLSPIILNFFSLIEPYQIILIFFIIYTFIIFCLYRYKN